MDRPTTDDLFIAKVEKGSGLIKQEKFAHTLLVAISAYPQI